MRVMRRGWTRFDSPCSYLTGITSPGKRSTASAVKVVLQHISEEGRLTSSSVRVDHRVECFLSDPGRLIEVCTGGMMVNNRPSDQAACQGVARSRSHSIPLSTLTRHRTPHRVTLPTRSTRSTCLPTRHRSVQARVDRAEVDVKSRSSRCRRSLSI